VTIRLEPENADAHCLLGRVLTTLERWEEAVEPLQALRSNLSQRFGRKVATAEEAREIMKVGVWYDSVEETLQNLGAIETSSL
jgi:hypothetical protein